MEAQKRLELYEKALIVYQKRVKKNDVRFYTCHFGRGRYYGFCRFFKEQGIRLEQLRELWELKPTIIVLPGHWWDAKNKQIRIKALKKAIETVKKLLK